MGGEPVPSTRVKRANAMYEVQYHRSKISMGPEDCFANAVDVLHVRDALCGLQVVVAAARHPGVLCCNGIVPDFVMVRVD
eukprot:11166218-Lingulodinium_polyedra.AAC.1